LDDFPNPLDRVSGVEDVFDHETHVPSPVKKPRRGRLGIAARSSLFPFCGYVTDVYLAAARLGKMDGVTRRDLGVQMFVNRCQDFFIHG
jgi:hypothetical protein